MWTTADLVRAGHRARPRDRPARLPAGRLLLRPADADVPWGDHVHESGRPPPTSGTPLGMPLHPTQLYDAGAELLILVFLLRHRAARPAVRRPHVLALHAALRDLALHRRDLPRRRARRALGAVDVAVRLGADRAARDHHAAAAAGAIATSRSRGSAALSGRRAAAERRDRLRAHRRRPTDAGLRLDQFLARHLPDSSRSQIQRLIRDGHVALSRGQAKPALEVLGWPGRDVDVSGGRARARRRRPRRCRFAMLYDDDDIVGRSTSRRAWWCIRPRVTRAARSCNALLHHVGGLSGVGGRERPGIVHRLDRGTSGVMVIAKHDRAHRELARQFHDREVEKEYLALVWGTPARGRTRSTGRSAAIRDTARRCRRGRRRARTALTQSRRGRAARRRLARARRDRHGRTHQIRVHLGEAGHPVVGDALYGGVRRRLPPGRLAPTGRLEPAVPARGAARLRASRPTAGRCRSRRRCPPISRRSLAALRAIVDHAQAAKRRRGRVVLSDDASTRRTRRSFAAACSASSRTRAAAERAGRWRSTSCATAGRSCWCRSRRGAGHPDPPVPVCDRPVDLGTAGRLARTRRSAARAPRGGSAKRRSA